MSYLVLARKYRPHNFTEMVGQDHVVLALTHALTTQRLHHAYLFTGTRGVGKTTVSRILAKSLNCVGSDGTGGITANPCGVCHVCQDIDAGRFNDYTELDAASNRGVDEVQSLLEQAVYKPIIGRFKVFMIDEVHMLTNTAFNAMLKTLEEPPEYLKFVLATTDPQKVPVTVLSRCLQFNLRPMTPQTIRQQLVRVLQTEGVAADTQALKLLALAAHGSMRDALSLCDQAVAFGSGELTEATVRLMLGSVDRSYVLGLIDALARGDGRQVVETSEALRANGLSAASTLEEMSAVLQRMAVLQMVPDHVDHVDHVVHTDHTEDGDGTGDTDPESAELARLAGLMPADETQLLYSICLHGRADLGLAPDEYAALTMVLLRLLAFKPKPQGPVATAEKKTLHDSHRPLTLVKPVRPAPPTPPTPSIRSTPSSPQIKALPVRVQTASRLDQPRATDPTPVLVPTPEGDCWYAAVSDLLARDAIAAMVRELALNAQLVAQNSDQWLLRVEQESLRQPAHLERLSAALQAAGHAVRLTVEMGRVTDTPARRIAAQAEQAHQAATKIVLDDPFVQKMMQEFGAKIIPGSVTPVR